VCRRAGLDGCRKSCHQRDVIPVLSGPQRVIIPTELSGPRLAIVQGHKSYRILCSSLVCDLCVADGAGVYMPCCVHVYTYDEQFFCGMCPYNVLK
jgi:hypothetical protein